MQRFLNTLLVVALAATLLSGKLLRTLHAENQRLRSNCEALTEDVTLYRTSAGESAATVRSLELMVDEFREQHRADAERIEALGIRLRRAESYAKSVAEQRYEASIRLRDTVVVHDTITIFEGGDRWSHIEGTIANDTLHYELRTIDTLHQVVHRVPRRWLFFRFGTRGIRQEIWSSNPNTQLVYTEYVELDRKRRNRRQRY